MDMFFSVLAASKVDLDK